MDDILTPELVVYLPLWKRDGVTIRSDDGYGHICTVTGVTWSGEGGVFNNTANRIAIPSVKPVDVYTFSAWCKWNSLPAVQGYIYMDADDGYSWMRVNADGSLTADTYDTGSHSYSTAAGVITAGNWYFVTNVVDIPNDTRQIWVNDTLAKNDTTNVNNIGLASNWLLGFTATSLGGIMGEAFVYHIRRQPLEIHNLRLATKERYQ